MQAYILSTQAQQQYCIMGPTSLKSCKTDIRSSSFPQSEPMIPSPSISQQAHFFLIFVAETPINWSKNRYLSPLGICYKSIGRLLVLWPVAQIVLILVSFSDFSWSTKANASVRLIFHLTCYKHFSNTLDDCSGLSLSNDGSQSEKIHSLKKCQKR